MQFDDIQTPGLKARFLAWYDRKIVKGFYKSWSFIANAGAVLIGLVPDLINLILSSWGMIDSLPTLAPEHKLVLFAALHFAAMFLRVYKQKNMPQPTTPIAVVTVPSTVDVQVGQGLSLPVSTEIRPVDVSAADREAARAFVAPTDFRAMSFEDLVAFGTRHAASLVDGVPWSFTFNGHAVTHEHDDLYLINDGIRTLRFNRGDTLWLGASGALTIEPRK